MCLFITISLFSSVKDSSEKQQVCVTEEQPTGGAENGHDKKKKRKKHDKEQGAVKNDECETSFATNDDLRKTKKHKRKRMKCDDSSEDLDAMKQHLTASLSNGEDDVPTSKRVHLDSGRKHKHKRKRTVAA